jgi:hypothetical protein
MMNQVLYHLAVITSVGQQFPLFRLVTTHMSYSILITKY